MEAVVNVAQIDEALICLLSKTHQLDYVLVSELAKIYPEKDEFMEKIDALMQKIEKIKRFQYSFQ